MAPHALPPAWSALLCGLRDAFGRSRGTLADAWDLTLACLDDRTACTVAPRDDL